MKTVQHLKGGIVSEILVKEGDTVKAGDVVVRLDDTVTRAALATVVKQLCELKARRARLEAERDDQPTLVFPEELAAAEESETTTAGTLAGERTLFLLRRSARDGEKAQLRKRIGQFADEASGLGEQKQANENEAELIETELAGLRKLWAQKFVSLERITALERDAVRLQGEHGRLVASIASAKGRLTETELQILQVDQNLRSEVASDLRDVDGKFAELGEREVTAEDELKHVEIRSPQNGVVHDMAVHTVGGVVAAGQPIMQIVPVADALTVAARIAPQDIDQLRIGQAAVLHFSAFNRQTTPELNGVLTEIAADLTVEERTGAIFYTARVGIPRSRARQAQRPQADPGHAGGAVLPDRRADHALLSDQAALGPDP